jgi:hypothetical protein
MPSNHDILKKDYKTAKLEEGLDSVLRSRRDDQLVLATRYDWKNCDPVLTVELTTKWYELILIVWDPHELDPDDPNDVLDLFRAYSVHFGHLEKVAPAGVSPYLDHAPNPLCVNLFACRKGFHVDELALELITGRWQIEYVESRVMQCDRCEGTGEVVIKSAYDLIPYIKNDSTCRKCRGHGVLKPDP